MGEILRKSSNSSIKDLKLNVLLEITKSINGNASTEELLYAFEDFLRNQLMIEKLVLFSNDNGWKCILKYGINDPIDIDVENDLIPIQEITSVYSSDNIHFKPYDMVIPVFHKSEPLAYLLIGDIYDNERILSPTIKHLPFIQTLTNIIIVAVENKRLAKERLIQEGTRKELELASQMQSMLFPSDLPNNDHLEMAASYLPHREVGGDYYDYIRINKNEIVFCVADVSGKGVSAALLMSNFQANLRALIVSNASLIDVVKELNTKVMMNAKGEKFITLFIARYNEITRALHYINAGHNPPILLSEGTVSMLKVGTTGLGMFDELIKVKEGIITLSPGSVLLSYTDGIVELENEQNEDFGYEKLKATLKKNGNKSMLELNNVILKRLKEFKGSKPYIDDIAILSCKMY